MNGLNDFDKELLRLFGEDKFRAIINTKVGIAGCGGLGSNCAVFLVRSGFRKIKLVDFDTVDYSNLNRQFYFYEQKGTRKVAALRANLERINPSVQVEILIQKIDKDNVKGIFSDCPVIVEAFDRAEDKSMIASELIREKELIVSASGVCGIGSSDDIRVRRVKDNFVIVGDMVTSVDDVSPFAPKVAVAAAKQADVVLEHVLRMKSPRELV